MSIQEVFGEFMQLGTVQASGYEFLAIGLLPEQEKSRRADILTEMKQAEKLLESGLEAGFEAEDISVPRELDEARTKAAAAITTLRRKLRDLDASEEPPEDEALEEAYNLHKTSVVPAIGAFLERFQGAMAALDKDSNDSRRSVITNAVSEIDDINGVINLISVNASVEAARAGEAGRGFAVIASEIQTLSQRSKQAVHDIRTRLG